MSKLTIAIPSKGRLQENTHAFFGRSGLKVLQPGGARNYRGKIAELPDVEIVFLSASEIARELAEGSVHLGITGLDLVHENITSPEDSVHIVTPLGFGYADVVVAVPKAWIDVENMNDLNDVASDFRNRHGTRLRVATKYVHLTRAFFAQHGLADYRIVESAGATEGAPAAGSAELIVDITTTGSTLVANNLKILNDGVMLKSQAHLVASRKADWDETALNATRAILDRIAAEEEARGLKKIQAKVSNRDQALAEAAKFGASAPFGTDDAESSVLTLLCPKGQLADCAKMLIGQGSATVTVQDVDYVFREDNPIFSKLSEKIGRT